MIGIRAKSIDIYKKTKIRDKDGITRDKYLLIETLNRCGVQDVGKISKKEEYGYTTENIKSVHCDWNENIKIGNIMVYNHRTYKIDKIVWGMDNDCSHIHFLAVETKVNING